MAMAPQSAKRESRIVRETRTIDCIFERNESEDIEAFYSCDLFKSVQNPAICSNFFVHRNPCPVPQVVELCKIELSADVEFFCWTITHCKTETQLNAGYTEFQSRFCMALSYQLQYGRGFVVGLGQPCRVVSVLEYGGRGQKSLTIQGHSM